MIVRKPGYRWALLIAGLAALAAIWIAFTPADKNAPSGVVNIQAKAPTPGPAAVAPEVAIPAVPTPAPFAPTPEVLAALKLPAGSTFRAMITPDADDGVTCGEVSSSQGDRRFRRFVYIASAKAGFVDDGGPVFRQISATSCNKR